MREQIFPSRFVKGEPRCSPPNRKTKTIFRRGNGGDDGGENESEGRGLTLNAGDSIAATGELEWSGMPLDAERRIGKTWVRSPTNKEIGAFAPAPAAPDGSVTVSVPRRRMVMRGDADGEFVVRVGGKIVCRDLTAEEARDACEVLRERGKRPIVSMR